ncbi:hypothetical protein I7I48_01602 [Histoplasma ohiense]|nr:hypothetical protein I7I48_01602 [Histoplasma ohiense (nom. inval.)]
MLFESSSFSVIGHNAHFFTFSPCGKSTTTCFIVAGKKTWEMKPSPIIVESTHRCRESTLLFMIDGSLSRDLNVSNQGFIHVDHMKGFHLVLTIFLFLSLPTPYHCDSPF